MVHSPIVDFYRGDGTDQHGRNIKDILAARFDWWEHCHDHIQWLFPLREPSQFNSNAPLLTDSDISYFQDNTYHINEDMKHYVGVPPYALGTNYTAAVVKFTRFLGIKPNFDNTFELADWFESQGYTWLSFNHNSLRITRFLQNMRLFGYKEYPRNLLQFMKSTAGGLGLELPVKAVKFWEEAVADVTANN